MRRYSQYRLEVAVRGLKEPSRFPLEVFDHPFEGPVTRRTGRTSIFSIIIVGNVGIRWSINARLDSLTEAIPLARREQTTHKSHLFLRNRSEPAPAPSR